jgi:hypothetical protein
LLDLLKAWALVLGLCVLCAAQENIVVVGNQAQPVAWQHRNTIQESVNLACRNSPPGTVIIPFDYAGSDTYSNSCSALVWDMRTWNPAGSGAVSLPWVDLKAAGAACNGTSDDTAILNAALTTVSNAGGGTVVVPAGVFCKIAGQITLPNTGAFPVQKPIRITSWGNPSDASSAGAGGTVPRGGGLDLTFNSSTGKIDTRGAGYLEIDHVTLKDSAADCAPFLFTTNTVLHVHDVEFYGTAAAASACNDAIILGGTSTTIDGTAAAPFQGYGTVIRDNFFGQIQRAVYARTFANAIQIRDNTVWSNSGFTLGGAFDISPNGAGQSAVGNIIDGNLIEVTFYKYGIWLHGTGVGAGGTNHTIMGNGCWDPTVTHTACIRLEAGSDYNLVLDGYHNDAYAGLSDVDGTSTYLTSHQNQQTLLTQPVLFSNIGSGFKGTNTSQVWDIFNTGDNTESYFQMLTGGTPSLQLVMKPAGGTAVNLLKVTRSASNQSILLLGDAGAADIIDKIDVVSGADLRLESTNSGNVVWLCGGAAQCKTWVNNTGQLSNNLATGTPPFVITSTTPVPNLTTVPTTYNHSGTQQTAVHIVEDTATLSTGAVTVTLVGSAQFTSNATYSCTANDNTAANPVQVTQTSASSITFTGTGSDVVHYICVGN